MKEKKMAVPETVRQWDASKASDKLHELADWMHAAGYHNFCNELMSMSRKIDSLPDTSLTPAAIRKSRGE